MREVNATEIKSQFGVFLDLAKDEPIGIRKSGKLTTVMLSAGEYEHLQKLEDAYWLARAEAADASGEWIKHTDAIRLLTDRLKQAE